jgi:hypothetical protein
LQVNVAGNLDIGKAWEPMSRQPMAATLSFAGTWRTPNFVTLYVVIVQAIKPICLVSPLWS